MTMTFDPLFPSDNSEMKASEYRAQCDALKSLIDALEVRVAALELPPLTASGFGAPEANGPLIVGDVYRVNNAGLYVVWL
jgi:hypothetical protein